MTRKSTRARLPGASLIINLVLTAGVGAGVAAALLPLMA